MWSSQLSIFLLATRLNIKNIMTVKLYMLNKSLCQRMLVAVLLIYYALEDSPNYCLRRRKSDLVNCQLILLY